MTEKTRNALVFGDTAINALTGVLVVMGAARAQHAESLANFSLAQLVVTTAIGIVRAAAYNPALALQRSTGRRHIPASWAFLVPLPASAVIAAGMALFLPGLGGSFLATFLPVFVASAGVLVADGLRSALMSWQKPAVALVADAIALVGVVFGYFVFRTAGTAAGGLYSWGLPLAVSALIALVAILRSPAPADHGPQSLRHTWSLGRWSFLDAALAGITYLLPMFVATIALGTTSAGTYRVLQTAMGPLNILYTTFVTVFGLDSWQTANLQGLRDQARKVRVSSAALFGLGALSAVVGLPIMAIISDLNDPDLVRIAVIVGLQGCMLAFATPFTAAGLALGYQRYGALIRFVVLVACFVVILPPVIEILPWHDPIGANMIASNGLATLGWWLTYRHAMRRETAALSHSAPPD